MEVFKLLLGHPVFKKSVIRQAGTDSWKEKKHISMNNLFLFISVTSVDHLAPLFMFSVVDTKS